MDRQQAEQDIKMIRQVMEQSARYTHFSGLSGPISGVLALAGCAATYWVDKAVAARHQPAWLIVTWSLVLVLSIAQDMFLAQRKARRNGQTIWVPATYRLMKSVLPGVYIAFILSVVALYDGAPDVIPAVWALGYGTALCAAGMISVKEVWMYGIVQLVTGTVGLFFMSSPPYSLYLLALTFGVYQILFGIVVTRRYGS